MLNVRKDKVIIEAYKDFMLMTPSRQKDELSGYAAKDIREFIAECWSEFRNNPECRTIAKKVGNRIIQIRNSNSHDSIGQRQIEQPMGPTK